MINEEIYEELKDIFAEYDISLTDTDILLYADLFEIISYFTHNKLDTYEIFLVYDFLTDLLAGKHPQIMVSVSKEDRIRAQLRIMEEFPLTAGKLDDEEKEALAFCVYYSTFVQLYDEEKNKMVNGLVDFTSIERAEKMLEWEKSQRPDFFKPNKQTTDISKYDFGYTKENPIQTTSIPMAYEYLNKLRYKNKPIKYKRLGSTPGMDKGILDIYEICVYDKKFFLKKERKFTVYINSYSYYNSKSAPKDFTL